MSTMLWQGPISTFSKTQTSLSYRWTATRTALIFHWNTATSKSDLRSELLDTRYQNYSQQMELFATTD